MLKFFMNDYFYRHYNCAMLTDAEWDLYGSEKREFYGFASLCFGFICLIIYIPFVITMGSPKFFCKPNYKFMFFLGLCDIVSIFLGTIISGHLLFEGSMFCKDPTLIYFTGLFGVASWCCSCIVCLLLTFHRCVAIYSRKLAYLLFGSNKIWIWLLIPLVVGLYIWIVVFRSIYVFAKRNRWSGSKLNLLEFHTLLHKHWHFNISMYWNKSYGLQYYLLFPNWDHVSIS